MSDKDKCQTCDRLVSICKERKGIECLTIALEKSHSLNCILVSQNCFIIKRNTELEIFMPQRMFGPRPIEDAEQD